MAYVPAGTFAMGSTNEDINRVLAACRQKDDDCARSWFEDGLPKHELFLDAFWIDQTEVINAQFAIFLSELEDQTAGTIPWYALSDIDTLIEADGAGNYRSKAGFAYHPATLMTWYAAQAYCEWTGGLQLTEAHWEYGAKGKEGFAYPWGIAAARMK